MAGSGAWHDTANSYKVIKGINSVMGAEGRFVSRLVKNKGSVCVCVCVSVHVCVHACVRV